MQEEVVKENKKCIKCKKFKDIDDFGKDRTRKSGRHPYCKKCQKVYINVNKEAKIKRAILWNKNNPERRSEITKKWTVKNKHLTSYYKAVRRKREKNLSDGTLIPENINKLNKNICGICKKSLDWSNPSKIHLDHIIPLSKNGKHSITNVQWTHAKCNLSKNDKIL
jgi:5-methylcytosine-specific restriction endonuclease McrA